MSDGKIFVRNCPRIDCGKLHHTADQTAKTPCDACVAKDAAAEEAKKGKPAEAPKADADKSEETLKDMKGALGVEKPKRSGGGVTVTDTDK